jgi:hypothetical protein
MGQIKEIPADALIVQKIITGGEAMKGRIYRAAVAVKDFGERSRMGFVTGIGKTLREIAMRITRIG